jgi:hypothetical protein
MLLRIPSKNQQKIYFQIAPLRVLKYLKKTSDWGIHYKKNFSEAGFGVEAYSDADLGSIEVNARSLTL